MEQDNTFYREFGDDMSLSGGECRLQPDFAAALPAKAHERGRIRQRDHPSLDLDGRCLISNMARGEFKRDRKSKPTN